jgi:predicted Zn-dependent protease with MMP-like domain
MNDSERARFDALVEEAIDQLPEKLRVLLDEVPVVVLDRPTGAMLRDLDIDPGDEAAASEICGLHSGTPETDASVENPVLTSTIHLFREGIVGLAGGWTARNNVDEDDEEGPGGEDAVYEEIMVTLLHEMGHQFGLDEEDLEQLGYG